MTRGSADVTLLVGQSRQLDEEANDTTGGSCFAQTDGALHCSPDQTSCYTFAATNTANGNDAHVVCVTSSGTKHGNKGKLTGSHCDGATLDGNACASCQACSYLSGSGIHGHWPFAVDCSYTAVDDNGEEMVMSFDKTCPTKPTWWLWPLLVLLVAASRCWMLWRLPGPKKKTGQKQAAQEMVVGQPTNEHVTSYTKMDANDVAVS